MTDQELWWFRLALLDELVKRAPLPLGRTALMKFIYFLQTLRGLPCGYKFRIYTYGPFDDAVLHDIQRLESLGGVNSRYIEWIGGYGYEFEPGPKNGSFRPRIEAHFDRYEEHLKWVLAEFGQRSAADLELLSTIIHVHKEATASGQHVGEDEMTTQVCVIKPHFSDNQVRESIKDLKERAIIS